MKIKPLILFTNTVLSLGLAGAVLTSSADDAVFGGPVNALDSGSGSWAWSGVYMAEYRAGLANPANFGLGAPSENTLSTIDLATIDAASLDTIDVFVSSWWREDQSSPYHGVLIDWFLSGGELLLLQDDAAHDGIGEALGISSSASTGTPSVGDEPIFEGPFGSADGATQSFLIGQLSAADIAATGGSVAGTNQEGQITVAYWCENDYAPGAGGMVIIADIDMISTGPDANRYDSLNPNSILAFNSSDFLAERCIIEVDIDIKPDDYPNSVNPSNKGVIPVAILTTDDFDALTVDTSTLAFGPNGARVAHNTIHEEDVDGDGDIDLMLHFKTQETGIVCGDTEIKLTGETFDGDLVEGTDTIETKGC